MVNISRARRVQGGGTSSRELEWLAEQARPRSRILELGSFRGRSARAMLDNSQAHLWCVDHWTGPAGRVIVTGNDYRIFLNTISDVSDRVTVLKMTTREALRHLIGESLDFDMIFIDADHSYESVMFDITHYAPLLEPGQLLCGHDYSAARWPGVVRAVKELFGRTGLVETLWWVKRPLEGFAWEVRPN